MDEGVSHRLDLNQRQPSYEPGALTAELRWGIITSMQWNAGGRIRTCVSPGKSRASGPTELRLPTNLSGLFESLSYGSRHSHRWTSFAWWAGRESNSRRSA